MLSKTQQVRHWIKTRYSEVFWTAQPKVDLPSEVKAQFKGKAISITGFEVDVMDEYNESVPEFLVYPFSNLSLPQGTIIITVRLYCPILLRWSRSVLDSRTHFSETTKIAIVDERLRYTHPSGNPERFLDSTMIPPRYRQLIIFGKVRRSIFDQYYFSLVLKYTNTTR